jgi:signal peptidase I
VTPDPVDSPPADAPVDAHLAEGGPDSPDSPDGAIGVEARPRRSTGAWLLEWVVILVVILGFTFLLRAFVIQTFSIPSGSMLPTLQIGDRIVVDKLDFHVHRGSIVVFKRPPLEEQDYPDLVKRVVGLPGETVTAKDGNIYIDGKLLAEPWLPKGPDAYTAPIPGDPHPQFNLPAGGVKVPPDEYFVMGDNRTNSEDSRWFGPIPRSLIVGRAVAVVWPFSQIKGL